MKRRSSTAVTQDCVPSSVKRTKVQAQRKFAQNNYTYSSSKVIAKTPEEYKPAAMTTQISSPENEECELNTFSSLPTVDDLLTFLCFRGTDVLPAKLNYLSSPQFDVLPNPKKCTKTYNDNMLSLNHVSINPISDEPNKRTTKSETNNKSLRKLDERKKLRSRSLTTGTNVSKTARSLALKHNQRLRSKNVVQAKICESKLKNKPASTLKNTELLVANNYSGRSTRTSTRTQIDHPTTSLASPPKRVTRKNLASPPSKELHKKVKLNSSSSKRNNLITNELSVRLEDSCVATKSLPLPKSKSNTNGSGEVIKKAITTPTKPITRSNRSNHSYREESRSTRLQNTRLAETLTKSSSELSVRTTRSGSALLDEGSRNAQSEEKLPEVGQANTRPTRRTKEAAAFYMELLGKELLCPGSDDDDDCSSIGSFPELPNADQYLRHERELGKQPQKIISEKPRKTGAQKPKTSTNQVVSKPAVGKTSEISVKKSINEQPIKLPASEAAEERTSRKPSEILQMKESNVQLIKLPSNQTPVRIVTRRASDTSEMKHSNDTARTFSRKKPEIVEMKRSHDQSEKSSIGQVAARPILRRKSEILETKRSNEQSSTKALTIQVSAKPALRRASEILDSKNSSKRLAKPLTSQVSEKPALRRASEILESRNSSERLTKPYANPSTATLVHRRASEISDLKKISSEKFTKSSTVHVIEIPDWRKSSEISELKNSSEQSLKSTTSQAITRRASETAILLNSTEQRSKSLTNELAVKPTSSRPFEMVKLVKTKELENKTIVPKTAESKEMEKVDSVSRAGVTEVPSPTTIEVTIKDLTKRQKPEKSVFEKKVLSVKPSVANMSKDESCKTIGTQIRDLTKSGAVELIEITKKESLEKDDPKSLVVDTVKVNKINKLVKNKSPAGISSIPAGITVTPIEMTKNLNSEKKIFRKSEGELIRKSEAFSPDNEKSVYAFEPDLPTTSPPFRRLKSVTPPKMLSVNNSVAVQVNFGKDVKVECSSTGDTQVSSTTDSGGDRVFYIPIQTSEASSTLGVAVKLGTDGPNQKIFMSATLITNSPAFTTNTMTNVPAKSLNVESICVQTDTTTTKSSSSSTANESSNEQTLKNRKMQKSSPTKVQSVKILKLNKNKKVDQGTNVDLKTKFESTSMNKTKKVDRGTNMNEMNPRSESSVVNRSKTIEAKFQTTESESTLANQSKKVEILNQSIKKSELKSMNQNKKGEISQSASKSEIKLVNPNKKTEITSQPINKSELKSLDQNKEVETVVQVANKFELKPVNQNKKVEMANQFINMEKSKMKSEPTLSSKNKKMETTTQSTNPKSESRTKSKKEDKEKLPVSEASTKKLTLGLTSEKVESLSRTASRPDDESAISSVLASSQSSSNLCKSNVQGKSSVKIVKVNKSKKAESSGNSSGTDSPIPTTPLVQNNDVVAKSNVVESKHTRVDPMETKSKVKVKRRSIKSKVSPEQPSSASASTSVKTSKIPGKILEAPTFRPSKEEFNDPLEFIESIRPTAEKFGLCRIIPPSGFRPECKVADEMRFTAYNQYVHKMLHRWGPNVKEMMAIKKFLATQNIQLTQAPWIGGMEVDLPRLYQTVQQCGGLSAVIESGRWQAVADIMRIPKLAQDRITKLDDIYCKYLLPYDILSHEERERIFDEVEKEWVAHSKKLSDDELFEDVDECVIKGRTMPLSSFYRIARNTMMMCFGSKTNGEGGPTTETIEREFWNHVSNRKAHICVHSGSIDSGTHGYGFSTAKNSTFRKHPWNLKVLTNNVTSILRFLGPLMGVTVPTLHVGMLYSAFCWYRDPHGLPWIEYLHTGADKIWYGIPDEHSELFKEAMLALAPRFCRDKKIWLSSDTVMIPPPLLIAEGVSLSRVVQQPGQFIVVFPKAFTSSISTGYLVSESVYFAQPSWLDSAKQIFTDLRDSCEPSVFSLEQLLISIAEDARPNVSILSKILPLLSEVSETESNLRVLLRERGVNTLERLNTNKKRKSRTAFQEEEYYECDVCHSNLFVSMVVNSVKQNNYCLQHAAAMLQKKSNQAKHCKLLYAYTEEELIELVDRVKSRIEAKSGKK